MSDKPILFSAPMVRALLDGRKTQTRRFLTAFTDDPPAFPHQGVITALDPNEKPYRWPRTYAVGDRLWVRESGHLLREAFDHNFYAGVDVFRDAGFQHAADGFIVPARVYDTPLAEWAGDCARVSRPSIHMLRWASRLTLVVTDVRVERLQDISEADAIAEGVQRDSSAFMHAGWWVYDGEKRPNGEPAIMTTSARDSFASLWRSINGPGSWQENPWVAAYTFRVLRGNIDAVRP